MMTKTRIKLGYCPTRRDVFDRKTAIEYGEKIRKYIEMLKQVISYLQGKAWLKNTSS